MRDFETEFAFDIKGNIDETITRLIFELFDNMIMTTIACLLPT